MGLQVFLNLISMPQSCSVFKMVCAMSSNPVSLALECKKVILLQLKVKSTDATDLEICVSGGLVLANVANVFLLDVS